MANENEFLEPDQLEDYHSSFRNTSFSPDDFELLQERVQPKGTFYDPQAGKVTVRCKLTNVEKDYVLSSGNDWPSDFSNDLRTGIFGQKA